MQGVKAWIQNSLYRENKKYFMKGLRFAYYKSVDS